MQYTHRNNELIKHFIEQNLALGKESGSAVDINVLGSDLQNVCANFSSNCLILQGILPLPHVFAVETVDFVLFLQHGDALSIKQVEM